MITKDSVKLLKYLDRDSNPKQVFDEMTVVAENQFITLAENHINQLNGEEAGEYRTVEITFKIVNKALEKMNFFFRGAVVPYYARQKHDYWHAKIPKELLEDATDDIKRAVGFVLYDHTGHQTDQVNSLTSFRTTKQFTEWLNDVEEVVFGTGANQMYIFPNSDHFNELVEKYGRDVATVRATNELMQQYKNKGMI